MSGDLDFGDFLERMGNETSGRKKKKLQHKVQEQVYIPPKPKKKAPIVEAYVEPIKEEHKVKPSTINEEFMDKAYDYAQGVVKVIRSNFKSTEERVIMLESIHRAINYYMQSVGAQLPSISESQTEQTNEANLFGGETMSESAWNNMPKTTNNQVAGSVQMNDLTGQTVASPLPKTGDYNTGLKLGIKIAPDGKQEADISGITSVDINEMKVLAGMIGPEAENRNKELHAAKQAIHQQMVEKENQVE